MLRKKFNVQWHFMKGSDNPLVDGVMNVSQAEKEVLLPHDAMAYEERNSTVISGSQSGFYPGGSYSYRKEFAVPKEWAERTTVFEFEGVYTNAKVFINGSYAGGCTNGYRNFYIPADMFLKYGETNELKVTVNNTAQPNSRWYSGSGIYRDVNILQSSRVHVVIDGQKITTPVIQQDLATVVVETPVVNEGCLPKEVTIETEILDNDNQVVASESTQVTIFSEPINIFQRMSIKAPSLWMIDSPSLYTCRTRIKEENQVLDEEVTKFGIREIRIDAVNGLQINGESIKLKGSCLHHDNGVIGAISLPAAEERRCRLLKAAGFNCIRSAHQPISKAMLAACDRVGLLVIDELSDVWNIGKNHNDYANYFEEEYQKDVASLVAKDFNHPSVIMYCLGNEQSEAGTKKGAELNRKINTLVKTLDPTRFTTNAINGLTAASAKLSLIFGELQAQQAVPANDVSEAQGNEQVSEKAADSSAEQKQSVGNDEGSNGVNSMMAMLVGPVADIVATHPLMNEAIEEFASGTDIAGYNYMPARHALEAQTHPNRIILGTESFPSDIARLWKIVQENAHVIGDMTWTGIDYIGEAGIGDFYYDGSQPFSNNWPDLVSYCGDIDIIGQRKPISYYREIIFGLRQEPYIAVKRINRTDEDCLHTPWAFKDALNSWTWLGYEGVIASVIVFSDADEVELFLNDVSLGRQTVGISEPYTATFEVAYQPGTLTAVCYRDQVASQVQEIRTAEEEVALSVSVDKNTMLANGEDLVFVEIALADQCGTVNTQQVKEVKIQVSGSGQLEGFGSGIAQTDNNYKTNQWKTHDGRLLAVVRATQESGEIKLTVKTDEEHKEIIISALKEK